MTPKLVSDICVYAIKIVNINYMSAHLMYIHAALQICRNLTNRMHSDNCLVWLVVCYAC